MTQNDETPRGLAGASHKNLAAGGGGGLEAIVPHRPSQGASAGTAQRRAARRPSIEGRSAAPIARRTPGQWPDTSSPDEIGTRYAALMREKARRVLVMQSIRASLQEQPSVRAVTACARRWVADILRTAEDVAKSKREHSE